MLSFSEKNVNGMRTCTNKKVKVTRTRGLMDQFVSLADESGGMHSGAIVQKENGK